MATCFEPLRFQESQCNSNLCSIIHTNNYIIYIGICLGVIREAYSCPCGHTFGKNCLFTWISRKPACPTCREPCLAENIVRFMS